MRFKSEGAVFKFHRRCVERPSKSPLVSGSCASEARRARSGERTRLSGLFPPRAQRESQSYVKPLSKHKREIRELSLLLNGK